MERKSCCLAGYCKNYSSLHELKLKVIDKFAELVLKGYSVFYILDYGVFDKACMLALDKIKKTNNIKIVRVLVSNVIWPEYTQTGKLIDEYYCPNSYYVSYCSERTYYRNMWVLNNSDVILCYFDDFSNGYFDLIMTARDEHKPIIYLN
ncbi:MAG: hypothetical protein IJZ26_02735 [Clostridia bacterium]|nr:hypothetical protein [Clostridia bacterium]